MKLNLKLVTTALGLSLLTPLAAHADMIGTYTGPLTISYSNNDGSVVTCTSTNSIIDIYSVPQKLGVEVSVECDNGYINDTNTRYTILDNQIWFAGRRIGSITDSQFDATIDDATENDAVKFERVGDTLNYSESEVEPNGQFYTIQGTLTLTPQ